MNVRFAAVRQLKQKSQVLGFAAVFHAEPQFHVKSTYEKMLCTYYIRRAVTTCK